jgi:tRNA G18 (ribose-2'-O)-methylase SpoU
MKKVVVVLHNIRSIYNVGAILRTCEGFGVASVVLSGWTPNYLGGLPHVREKNLERVAKVALGAEKMVPAEYVEDIFEWVRGRKAEEWKIVALEQAENSVMLNNTLLSKTLSYANIILILGEEVSGVGQDLLALTDTILEIPMIGKKESFNVSVAAGIALWEILGRDILPSKLF